MIGTDNCESSPKYILNENVLEDAFQSRHLKVALKSQLKANVSSWGGLSSAAKTDPCFMKA